VLRVDIQELNERKHALDIFFSLGVFGGDDSICRCICVAEGWKCPEKIFSHNAYFGVGDIESTSSTMDVKYPVVSVAGKQRIAVSELFRDGFQPFLDVGGEIFEKPSLHSF